MPLLWHFQTYHQGLSKTYFNLCYNPTPKSCSAQLPHHHVTWTQKMTEQSSWLCITQGLHWTPSCKICHSRCSHSFKSWLTHTFSNLWCHSWHSPYIPCGLQIILFFHWLCICSDSAPSHLWNPTYLTPTHWWNFQLCHHAGLWLANPFSYWFISKYDFLCHSVEFHNCYRILLAHLLQSLDWLGIWQHHVPAISEAQFQGLTLHQDTTLCSGLSKASRLCPKYSESHPTGNPMETPESYPHQCSCTFPCKQAGGLRLFQTLDLIPWGHWSFNQLQNSSQHSIPKYTTCSDNPWLAN